MVNNPTKCDNGDGVADHAGTVLSCGSCGGAFCQPCREAISGSADRCPLCNTRVGGDPNNCKVSGGGCGR
jgi:hypothetical protein